MHDEEMEGPGPDVPGPAQAGVADGKQSPVAQLVRALH